MQLQQNNSIYFNEGYHKYVDDNFNEYKGITTLIRQCVYDPYGDTPEDKLNNAGAHGTLCHKLCEAFDEAQLDLQDDGTYTAKTDIIKYEGAEKKVLYSAGETIKEPELYAYVQLLKNFGLFVEASEYLVSDMKNFASSIDKVIRESDNEFSILDLKFTYDYHEIPVRWQTSFYADMFELQNPDAKVKNLYCIHIHLYNDGKIKSQLHQLERIKTDILEECKRCYLTGITFDNPLSKKELKLTEHTFEIDGEEYNMETVAELKKLEKEVKAKMEKVMTYYKKYLADNPTINKLTFPLFTVAQTSATTSYKFDEARLKQELPEIYAQYCTGVNTTSPRTTLTLAKPKTTKSKK